jgi:hypothetical protein
MSEWEIKKKIKEKNKIIQSNIQSKNQWIKDKHYQNKRFKYDCHDIDIFINLPDDIVALIGTFINAKEIIAVERINKIYRKQYEIVNRSIDDWIKHLKQYPFLYSIKRIEEYKNDNVKIRIEKLTIEELNARIKEVYCDDYRTFNHSDIIVDKDKFMTLLYKEDWVYTMHTLPERFICRIIDYSKPTPRYLGQTYVDMRGYKYIVRYTNNYDCISHCINKSYWPREGMKGCFRHVFIWEHAFAYSLYKCIQ